MYNFYNFLNVTTYFYIYPRIMGVENVDYEFYIFYINANDDLKSRKL